MYKSLRAQTLHYFARPQEGIPTAPIASPAAWRGADMRESREWIVVLTPGEVDELRAAQRHAHARGTPMGEMTRKDFPLPTLAPRIAMWRDVVHRGRGFVLIRGVPVQEWSPHESETFFWCLGQHLGMPGAQNPQNDLLGHVRDQRTGEDVRYYRTNKALAVHTDTADIVGLLCLQSAKAGGLSRIASSVAVFNELLRRRPELVPRLFEPLYFDTKGEGGTRALPIAPCRYADGVLRTFWQSDYYRSVQKLAHVPRHTPAEIELLDAYDGIANSPEYYLDMALEPGDVQLLSNHTVLHARTAFEDWPEPERRRHLLRLWLSVPERRPLPLRWRRGLDLAKVLAAAAREIIGERRRGWSGGAIGSMGAGR
jgi:hypothetical protein